MVLDYNWISFVFSQMCSPANLWKLHRHDDKLYQRLKST